MRTNLWVVLIGLLSCVSNQEAPEDILEKDKLAEILTDIHLAEARVAKMNLGSMDSSVVVFNKLQQDIWVKHSVDSALYKKSYAFYASNPELMTKLYETVKEKLQSSDTTLNKPQTL